MMAGAGCAAVHGVAACGVNSQECAAAVPPLYCRVKAIKAMLPTAEGLYEMAGCEAARGPLARFQAAVASPGWE
jgi:hypothetical protein